MKYFLLIIIPFLFACQAQQTTQPKIASFKFFDLEEFFEAEVQKLEQAKLPTINKMTVVDRDTARIALSTIDFANELKLFSASNINKISWIDRYQVDTSFNSPLEQTVSYTALDERLQTRKVSIHFKSKLPKKVDIHNRLGSMIMDTDQYLTYEQGLGFSINILQVGKLQDSHDIYTEVRY